MNRRQLLITPGAGAFAAPFPGFIEVVLNQNSAKALGLTIPQPILVRADRVIE